MLNHACRPALGDRDIALGGGYADAAGGIGRDTRCGVLGVGAKREEPAVVGVPVRAPVEELMGPRPGGSDPVIENV